MKLIISPVPVVLWFLIVAVVAISRDDARYTYVDSVRRVERGVRRVERSVNTNELITEEPLTTKYLNETISEEVDNHDYYSVEYRQQSPGDWMDVNTLGSPLNINERLSNSDKHAVKVLLNFIFPFYGYDTNLIHVTSSGFLYVGTYSHRLLAETQYIAPLMADFTPNVNNNSTVSYYNGDSMFVAEWKNVHLRNHLDVNFTFQVVIYKNGTLVFSYKELPLTVAEVTEISKGSAHPVKVGLADAYYHDTYFVIFTRRIIYEYHSVNVSEQVVPNQTIVFTPLESCTARKTCESCTTNPPAGFDCVWCISLEKCSDGFDRHKQDWQRNFCHKKNTTVCPANPTDDHGLHTQATTTTRTTLLTSLGRKGEDICPTLDCGPGTCKDNVCICPKGYNGRLCQGKDHDDVPQPHKGSSHAGIALFLFVLIITILVIGGWVLYAYRNPNTQSGLTLIRMTRCYYCKGAKDSGASYKYQRTAENI